MFELNLPKEVEKLHEQSIPVVTIQAEESKKGAKPYYTINGNPERVEDFCKILFEQNGFKVESRWAREVFEHLSYYGDTGEPRRVRKYDDAEGYFMEDKYNKDCKIRDAYLELSKLRDSLIETGKLNPKLIDVAEFCQNEYREENFDFNPSMYESIDELYKWVRNEMKEEDLIKMIKFYHRKRGLDRGTPDLFVFKGSEFYFVEVKSDNDSLSKYQNLFIKLYKEIVGDNIYVLHVVNGNWN